MKRLPLLAASLLSLFLFACASGSGSTRADRSGDVITPEEIAALSVATSYDIVQRLRPGWLRGRGPASLSGAPALPVVYVDDIRSGGLVALERIPAGIVERITFVSGRDASVRYGLDTGGGVILVQTTR